MPGSWQKRKVFPHFLELVQCVKNASNQSPFFLRAKQATAGGPALGARVKSFTPGRPNSTEILFPTNSVEIWIPQDSWKTEFHKNCGKTSSTLQWKIMFHKFYGKQDSTCIVDLWKIHFPWILWKTEFQNTEFMERKFPWKLGFSGVDKFTLGDLNWNIIFLVW